MRASSVPHLIAVASLALAPPLAHADEPDEAMSELNARGFEAFDRGDYVGAAAIFAAAYDIYKDPNLLKNKSIALYKADDCEGASEAAEIFLAEPKTSARDRQEMVSVLRRCDAQREQIPPPPEEPVDEFGAARVAGVASMGLGVVLALGAGIYHAGALTDGDELMRISREGGDAARHAELTSSLSTARVALPLLYGASAALVGVGAWVVVSPTFETTPSTTGAAPPTGLRVGFHARF